eukprot:1196321-Prorocentrum_minimum.AAC.1
MSCAWGGVTTIGGAGGIQPPCAGTFGCGVVRRRLLFFFASLWRHRLVCGPEQLVDVTEPDKHHPNRDRAADRTHLAVSAPARRGSHNFAWLL